MANVEVDEVELTRLRQVGGIVHNIMRNPNARRFVEHAHKLVDANARTPTLDQEQVIAAPMVELNKKLDSFIEATTKDRDERNKNETIDRLKKQRDDGLAKLRRENWTDDGIKAVEALMEQKGLLDPLDAAAIYEKAHPPQTVAAPSSVGAWNFAEGITAEDPLKKLLDTKGRNDLVADKMAAEALNDFRQQQPARR